MLTLLAWAVFNLWTALAGLIIGVILLDFRVQSALVSNQHIIFALPPDARARINTIFRGCMFLGRAAGSAAAIWAWSAGGWGALTFLGTGLAGTAVAIQIHSLTRRP